MNSFKNKITYWSLIRYALPTVATMVFFALYSIVDGIFISNFVGANALSAVNIVFPIIGILIGLSIMFSTGGSAIVARYMGEGNNEAATSSFSLITLSTLITGVLMSLICLVFIKPIIYMLGASEVLYKDAHTYLVIMLIFAPAILLKAFFDYFLVTAGVPHLSLVCSIMGGVINIVLDYIFIVPLDMGIAGAAIATCIGYAVPALVGIIYFFNRKHTLHFVKPKLNLAIIKQACLNGSSEMVTQLSTAVTTLLFNLKMMQLLGEDGVASITIILYLQFLLISALLGFTSGVSPRISYQYGAQDKEEIKKIVRYSYITIIIFSIAICIITVFIAPLLVSMFVNNNAHLYEITLNGLLIFSISFLVNGLNIFTSGMFTAFSNGKISAFISFLRTFVLFIIGIIILPYFFDINGIWLVVPVAEFITSIFSIIYMVKFKDTYMYGNILKK